MTRVFIVARSPALRAGLEALLVRGSSTTVVGTADGDASLETAIDVAEPDVVLYAMDDGEDVPVLAAAEPDSIARAPVLAVLVRRPTRELARAALRAGVRAILPLNATPEELDAGIAAAGHGLLAYPVELSMELLPSRDGVVRAAPTGPIRATPAGPIDRPRALLTPREVEILEMLADGLANKAIAARLGISQSTVKTHVASILEKLGAGTRAEAVAIGVRSGALLL